jgi:uncharacterized protein YecE (DUF72 family)
MDEEVFSLLRQRRVALCRAQAEDGIEIPLIETADWGYLRLRMVKYSDADLKRWIKTINQKKWEDVFVFFKHEEKATGPEFATRFLKLLK